jgi:hypothetical protein
LILNLQFKKKKMASSKLGIAALLGVCSAAAGAVWYQTISARKRDFEQGPKVALTCSCGKFKGNVSLPKSGNNAGFHVSCHCVDCRKWATQAVKHGGIDESGGYEVLMIYKGAVTFDTPELIKNVRLYPKSNTHRLMTSCCETSVGGTIGNSPIFGLSGAIVKDDEKDKLVSQLSNKYLVHLKDRKAKEFANDPNAYETLPPKMVFQFINFILKGVSEMGSPSPVGPIDLANEQVIFPDQTA